MNTIFTRASLKRSARTHTRTRKNSAGLHIIPECSENDLDHASLFPHSTSLSTMPCSCSTTHLVHPLSRHPLPQMTATQKCLPQAHQTTKSYSSQLLVSDHSANACHSTLASVLTTPTPNRNTTPSSYGCPLRRRKARAHSFNFHRTSVVRRRRIHLFPAFLRTNRHSISPRNTHKRDVHPPRKH
ncbi:hypothetical protein CY34DRAFT_558455 [Suillus luteus UH-Slu-Lm8-n1]|uniref:Uncharacterized protein n=1 Tax=Suillus luteus UH-Slu-Lm8-n1 TaxID=930992 RepID=A0A0D0ACE6_9AGAM|nr:hypothetical protein CY34DRAFT_558455 [Suillus luteus UH-Slu-Lm8-n1]